MANFFPPPPFGGKISRVELEWWDFECTSVDLSRRLKKKKGKKGIVWLVKREKIKISLFGEGKNRRNLTRMSVNFDCSTCTFFSFFKLKVVSEFVCTLFSFYCQWKNIPYCCFSSSYKYKKNIFWLGGKIFCFLFCTFIIFLLKWSSEKIIRRNRRTREFSIILSKMTFKRCNKN